MTTITDVEQALTNARVLEDYWMSNGWESLEIEKDKTEILDIYPLVEVDISVFITIKLSNKIYSVPLADVSSLSIDDCLVIGVENLYPDWEERVEANLGKLVTIRSIGNNWNEYKYLGQDDVIRVVKEKS